MEGPGNPGKVTIPQQVLNGLVPANQFLYFQVKGVYLLNLSPVFFAKDDLAGMFIMQHIASPIVAERPEALLNIMLLR